MVKENKIKTDAELITEYFTDLNEDFATGIPVSVEFLRFNRGGGTQYRISFDDETVSDWVVMFDETDGGTVTDATHFNQVI